MFKRTVNRECSIAQIGYTLHSSYIQILMLWVDIHAVRSSSHWSRHSLIMDHVRHYCKSNMKSRVTILGKMHLNSMRLRSMFPHPKSHKGITFVGQVRLKLSSYTFDLFHLQDGISNNCASCVNSSLWLFVLSVKAQCSMIAVPSNVEPRLFVQRFSSLCSRIGIWLLSWERWIREGENIPVPSLDISFHPQEFLPPRPQHVKPSNRPIHSLGVIKKDVLIITDVELTLVHNAVLRQGYDHVRGCGSRSVDTSGLGREAAVCLGPVRFGKP
mmetsp:Transcript_57887/g.172794  ORF Transcript_57887/g.172794 Transcript_57887/m.172794 type:complete len:271 (+) Transcript_57887:169-981(+)